LTAIEIGKLMGATVIAVARGDAKLEVCRKAGADHVIDAEHDDLRGALKALGGVDVVYDPVGGEWGYPDNSGQPFACEKHHNSRVLLGRLHGVQT